MKKTATPQSNDLLDFLNTPVQQPTTMRPQQQQQQQPPMWNMQPQQQPQYYPQQQQQHPYPTTNNFYQQPPVHPYPQQQQYQQFAQPPAVPAFTNPFDIPFTAPVVAQKPKSTNPFDDWTAPTTTTPAPIVAAPKPAPTFVAQQPLVQQQPKPQPPSLLAQQPATVPKVAPQVQAPSKPVVAQQQPIVNKPTTTPANLHPVPAKKPAADEQGKETIVKESDAPAWEDTWKKTSKDMDWMQKKSEQDTEFKNITAGSFAPMKQTTNWKKK